MAQFGGPEFKTNTSLREHRGVIVSPRVHVVDRAWADQKPPRGPPPRPGVQPCAFISVVFTAQRFCFPKRNVVVANRHLRAWQNSECHLLSPLALLVPRRVGRAECARQGGGVTQPAFLAASGKGGEVPRGADKSGLRCPLALL